MTERRDPEKIVREFKRKTRRKFNSEEKIQRDTGIRDSEMAREVRRDYGF